MPPRPSDPVCPVDATPLGPAAEDGTLPCPRCEGRFVPRAVLEAVLAAAAARSQGAAPPSAWPTVAYRKCPVCAGPMVRGTWRRVSGVMVDDCPHHGLWLDAGELDRIGAFLASGGADRAVENEAALAAERAATAKALARLEEKARAIERATFRRGRGF
jgi:Zn-finger nucleic acid-binding protein